MTWQPRCNYTECNLSHLVQLVETGAAGHSEAMTETATGSNDLRDRKRRLTLERIAEVGLKLFLENGYESTTLDAIAAASGISRRTFFYYLKSKEDVLMAHESGNFPNALRPTFLKQSPKQSPIDAARKTFLALASMYETKESILADQILRSIDTLRLRKEALVGQMEDVLAEAMYELWPGPARRAQ